MFIKCQNLLCEKIQNKIGVWVYFFVSFNQKYFIIHYKEASTNKLN